MNENENTVNIPLLRKAVEWAEAEAAKPTELCEWDQRYWVTPTGPHDANVTIAGGDWIPWNLTNKLRQDRAAECGTCYCIAGYVLSLDGPVRPAGAGQRAQEKLGLTIAQASDLFEAHNTIEDVRRIAEEIAGERL